MSHLPIVRKRPMLWPDSVEETFCSHCDDLWPCEVHELQEKLNNLLAVIHRDGGHYTGEHGLNKSVKDAMLISSERIGLEAKRLDDLARLRMAFDQHKEIDRQEIERLHVKVKRLESRGIEDMRHSINAALALHHEQRVYDECDCPGGHAEGDAGAIYIEDDGYMTCEKGYSYSICFDCHTADGACTEDTPTEQAWPCRNVKALRGEDG